MTPSDPIINGGGALTVSGVVYSLYGWLFAGMPGIAILVGIGTFIMTVLKLAEAWLAYKQRKAAKLRTRDPTMPGKL